MSQSRRIIAAFGNCFRALNKLSVKSENIFVAKLIGEESNSLLEIFVEILKPAENAEKQIFYEKIKVRLSNLFKLIKLIENLGISRKIDCLKAEKNILFFQTTLPSNKKPKNQKITQNDQAKKPTLDKNDYDIENEEGLVIFEKIKNNGGAEKNYILNQFPELTDRTLRRRLSGFVRKRIA